MDGSGRIWILFMMTLLAWQSSFARSPQPVSDKCERLAYDMDMAEEICASLPLADIEGVWLYPDDKVSVLILEDEDSSASNNFPVYLISVVETEDARLHPGDVIGRLFASVKDKEFRIELSTEKKNDLLLKPKSCIATLSNDGDSFVIKKQKSPFKGRLNLNLSRLLPGFWKIVSTGVSMNQDNSSDQPKVGMVKIFPSYDGNGSSKRKIRYL